MSRPAAAGAGAGLAGRPVTGVERRQVSDLPEVTVTVTGHQLIERECGCRHRTKAAAPQGAEAPVQYGPRIAAIIVYLYIGQFLSKGADRAGAGRAVRNPAVLGDGSGHYRPRRRAGRLARGLRRPRPGRRP